MNVEIPFVKMVGTGNDFLVVDTLHHPLGSLRTKWAQVAKTLCDRRYGVGADGLLVLAPSRIADCTMRVFNPDGSEAQMCGNGARCVASLIHGWHGRRRNDVAIETVGGLVSARVRQNQVVMRMPDPRDLRLNLSVEVDHRRLQLGYVNTGVPHAVVPVLALDQVDVERLGRQLRRHRIFQPQGTNVDFIEASPYTPRRLRIRTYERGVEGETSACGTGVTAAAVIHALRHMAGSSGTRSGAPTPHRIEVETRSGETLRVSLRVISQGTRRGVTDVTLEGPVQWVCQGVFPWPTAAVAVKGRTVVRV